MELARTIPYPAPIPNPSALRQVETGAYVDIRTDAQQPRAFHRPVEEGDQQGITGRRRHAVIVETDVRRPTVTSVFVNPQTAPKRQLTGLSQPPVGQASSAFVAQQLSQDLSLSESETDDDQNAAHQEASAAYSDTLGLTATVLGFQGFRERIA